MLTTTGIQNFGFEFDTTMLTVLPGTARVGNSVMKYDGTRTPFDDLTEFTTANRYQSTLLFLQDSDGISDMTKVLSDETSSIRALDVLDLPSDTSNIYSPTHPLGELIFFNDGTSISLTSYNQL